tara:strand:+ start:7528 stop:8508 length:981 start_codon:yes stop_codon:yes gene_type:complete
MKVCKTRSTALLGAITLFASSALGFSQEAKEEVLDSIRYFERPDGHSELQTAIVSFQHPEGAVVDLVGAVHIGDESYFRQINQLLSTYDVVLYELVGGPMEDRGKAQRDELGLTHLMQRVTQNILGLKYQLEGIDYSQPNFVHADATWDQWDSLMKSRDQNMATLFRRAMELEGDPAMKEKVEQMGSEEMMAELGKAITEFNPDKLKKNLAPLLANSETFIDMIEGDDGTVLISERNKIVMKAIEEQVAMGQKKVAVFYGAGHMPDFEKRLTALGYTQGDTQWIQAWDIGDGTTPLNGLDIVENLLKDDYVVESVMGFLRGLVPQE